MSKYLDPACHVRDVRQVADRAENRQLKTEVGTLDVDQALETLLLLDGPHPTRAVHKRAE